ncbi:Ornithine cyclodeaminase [Beijerinckiaceae bacterium RH AL1]|nr:Ornithine cyclodeaminase [Beijerinckiaceae bacterium RH CH11]VVB47031.1 Ornithine cyclodeaminase [Beijerinckiaceae bacterium RH AL8]VVC55639.1 Ornithine cyclodeaminase [Beijerinckiaceae bacterium RH AL1]
MVRYVGLETMKQLVAAVGVEPLLVGLTAAIEADFARWEAFEKAPRPASHSPHGVIELMPTTDGTHYAFKYVNGHPANAALGKLTVTGLGVLADVATGYPLLISEMTLLTALRTAATSALAARHLARRDARVMALIGLGAQSEFQALAFRALLGIEHLRVYDVDPAATRKFVRNLRGRGLTIVEAATAQEAVAGADIVTTATADKRHASVLPPEALRPGMHINAIGGDCPGKTELHPDVLRAASIFVEFEPQTRIEGDIQLLAPDHPVTELWRVVAGAAPGRRDDREITLFDSVGFAVEDFAALRFIEAQVAAIGVTVLDLVPDLAEPRDLFGLLDGGAAPPLGQPMVTTSLPAAWRAAKAAIALPPSASG